MNKLHTHPMMERECEIDAEHCIIDAKDLDEAKSQLLLLQEIEKITLRELTEWFNETNLNQNSPLSDVIGKYLRSQKTPSQEIKEK